MRIAKKVRKLAPYIHGEQPQGVDVIKINTNEAAYPPSAQAMKVLKDFSPELLRLYPSAECAELCAVLAKLNKTTADRVFVGNGSDEILSLMTDAFVEDNESIGTLDPSYSLYQTLAAIRGVKWEGWENVKGVKGAKVSLALITSPNNPTGVQIPPKEIAAFAKRFRGVVVVDEAYVDYAKANCMKFATSKTNRNIIVMRTFSKAYALAGLRVGYCVGPKDLIQALYKIKDSYNVDAIAQAVALAAVKDQPYLKALVRKVLKTRAWFVAELEKRGWDVMPSEANFVFARPPRPKTAKADAKRVFEGLRARKIFIRYFAAPKTADRVRITIGTDDQMKRVIRAIDAILGR